MSDHGSVRRPARILAALALTLAPAGVEAQQPATRYALILEQAPAASSASSREELLSAEGLHRRQQIEFFQRSVRSALAARKIAVIGSASTLVNAVFVVTSPDRVNELKSLPGVKAVMPMRQYRRHLNQAIQLSNAPAAWNMLNGAQFAGAGVKIAVIDSGIDVSHPMLQDPTLQMPAGYPKCTPGDCAFTNTKVIVARSYVPQLAAGTDPNPAADSRPDDLSARDRDGHGTSVAASAAGAAVSAPLPLSGMAPKAYLGSYKIYGSPHVNDGTYDDLIIQAVEDAVNDGMDVISFSSGLPSLTAPLDTGADCGQPAGVACDLVATAFENAVSKGVVVVASAGNEGQSAQNYPSFSTIATPASAPSVIAVGATSNAHTFAEVVSVPGSGVPSSLQAISVKTGDAYVPPGAISGRVVDVATISSDTYGCSGFVTGALTGSIALIQRGPASNACDFETKAMNAWDAGAVAVILYMADASAPIDPGGLTSIGIPVVMISNADASALRSFVATNPRPVLINPAGIEQSQPPNLLMSFSSAGPALGGGLKPDLVAPGNRILTAAESIDPLGLVYSATGYAVVDGTSFSAPIVAGAAALVKQKHPDYSPGQIKSALVNNAAQDVTSDDSGHPVNIPSVGGGRLDAGAAVNAALTVVPSTLSFGVLDAGTASQSIPLQVSNRSGSPVTLSLSVSAAQAGSVSPTLSKTSLTLPPGATESVHASLSGTLSAGCYSGYVVIQGSGTTQRIPYLFSAGSNQPANIIPLSGTGFDGTVGQQIPDGVTSFRLVDACGIPVPGIPVTWSSRSGVTLTQSDKTTDANGIAMASPVLGATPGSYSVTASAGGFRQVFSGSARAVPSVPNGGVVNGASFENGRAVAPGSYISVFGTALSDFSDYAPQVPLPMAIDYARVTFDVPAAGISLPGRLLFVSPSQINLQVPWELQGQTSVQVKVAINYSNGNVITVPLAAYSPAFFESGGIVAALDGSSQAVTTAHAVRRGETVQLFANALGPVTNRPASGEVATAANLSRTTTVPVVTIGGQNAPVSFSGLAPGFPGLYQVNATVPAGINPGTQSITIAIGGETSRTSSIPVQ